MTAPVGDAADVVAIVPIRSDSSATSLSIGGGSVLRATIQSLRAVPRIGTIVLALEGPPPEGLTASIDSPGDRPVLASRPVRGRWAAIQAALDVGGDAETVLVQDPNRPLVSPATIAQLLAVKREAGAVVVAAGVVSSMKRVVEGRVVATVPRESLFVDQGLWRFKRTTLEAALHAAVAEGWDVPNELALAHRAGIPIAIASAEESNVAVVSRADARFAELAIERGLASLPGPPAGSA